MFKSKLEFEQYLQLERKYSITLSRFRASNHKLPITTGRHQEVKREHRLCRLCDSGEVGDEYHYILNCTFFHEARSKHIKEEYSQNNPSPHNPQLMCKLFNSTDNRELVHLAVFCKHIMDHFEHVNLPKKKRKHRKTNTE